MAIRNDSVTTEGESLEEKKTMTAESISNISLAVWC